MGVSSVPAAASTSRLVDVLEDMARERQPLLHSFVEDGGLTLVTPGVAGAGTLEHRVVGPGPLGRPSRSGMPLFWGVEHVLPASLWMHASRFKPVRGRGLHVMPLGPVRGDVAESLMYQLMVTGDEIHLVRLRAGFKRRHVAKRMAHQTADRAVTVAERVTGTSPVAHALALSQAVEAARGWDVAGPSLRARIILAELERIVSHVGDLALLAASTGTIAAAADWFRLKERLLRYYAVLTGHRYLRGVVGPGGLRHPLSAAVADLAPLVSEVEHRLDAIGGALDQTNSYLDRLYTAGLLPALPDASVYWTGFVGKSAGLRADVRWDRPYGGYPALLSDLEPVTFQRPDAFGRYWVRLEEARQSLELLRRLPDVADAGLEAAAPHFGNRSDGVGYGLVEAPRGRLCYRVALADPAGDTVDRVSITTPSLLNWPAVPLALQQKNILQDFPIIDASFNLAVAALDL